MSATARYALVAAAVLTLLLAPPRITVPLAILCLVLCLKSALTNATRAAIALGCAAFLLLTLAR